MRADHEPNVLHAEPGLVERELELAHRARLVHPGVHEHHAASGRDRVGVPVRHAGPGKGQPEAPEAGQHPVGAGQFAAPCCHGRDLVIDEAG